MKELWFKTEGKKAMPYKLVMNEKTIYYPDELFKFLEPDETILYYRIKEDSIINRTLTIDEVFINDSGIWTINGNFGDVL